MSISMLDRSDIVLISVWAMCFTGKYCCSWKCGGSSGWETSIHRRGFTFTPKLSFTLEVAHSKTQFHPRSCIRVWFHTFCQGFSQNSPIVYHYGHKTPGDNHVLYNQLVSRFLISFPIKYHIDNNVIFSHSIIQTGWCGEGANGCSEKGWGVWGGDQHLWMDQVTIVKTSYLFKGPNVDAFLGTIVLFVCCVCVGCFSS